MSSDPVHDMTIQESLRKGGESMSRRYNPADIERIKMSLLPDSEALALIRAYEAVANAAFWFYSAVPNLPGLSEKDAALYQALRNVGWMIEVGDEPA